MKNKTKTYVLLIIVIAIWGIVGYRVIATLNPVNEQIVPEISDIGFKPKEKSEIDTFSIEIAERDPFLGTIHRSTSNKNNSKKNVPKPIVWIPISYQGMITKHQGSDGARGKEQQIFAITIENIQYLLKKNQTIKEVTLLKGNVDNITVQYKNRRKTIAVE